MLGKMVKPATGLGNTEIRMEFIKKFSWGLCHFLGYSFSKLPHSPIFYTPSHFAEGH